MLRGGGAAAAAVGDDGPADAAVAAADAIGLDDAARSIARSAAASHWRAGRLGAAAAWCARARDGDRGSVVADALIDARVPLDGAAPSLTAMLTAPRTTLPPRRGGVGAAVALLNWERALAAAKGDASAAAAAATAAAAAVRACPASMAIDILFAAVPLLEAGGVPESTVDDALAALADAEADVARAQQKGGTQPGEADAAAAETCAGAVRLALARALARAFVEG